MAILLGDLKLDCRTCTDELKIERGCEKDSPIQGYWKVGDWEFGRCPLKIIKPEVFGYIYSYNMIEKGILPNRGGWLRQPVKLIEAVQFIQRVVNELEDEKKK